MPDAMHSLMLFSSANAVSATIGAEKPNSRMRRVLWRPSRFGIYHGRVSNGIHVTCQGLT